MELHKPLIEDWCNGHCLTSKQGGYTFVNKHRTKNVLYNY